MLHRSRLAVLALALALGLSVQSPAGAQGGKQVIGTPTRTLSPAIRIGDLLFVSGQLGGRADTTIQDQTTTALNSMKTILESAGSSMANVVKCTVFLLDIKDFQGMNTAYSAAFPKDPPARSTVAVAALVTPTAKVEIECIAAAIK